METNIVTTPFAKLSKPSPDYLLIDFMNDAESMEDARIHVKMIGDNFFAGEKMPALVDFRKIKKLSREVRNYFSSEDVTRILSATAIMVKPGLSTMIGSFLLRFSKTALPIRLFTNEEKAIAWLKELQEADHK